MTYQLHMAHFFRELVSLMENIMELSNGLVGSSGGAMGGAGGICPGRQQWGKPSSAQSKFVLKICSSSSEISKQISKLEISKQWWGIFESFSINGLVLKKNIAHESSWAKSYVNFVTSYA